MRVLEVCAGVGGMALGLHRAGVEHAAFCEIEPYPRQVLARHFPGVPIFEDMTTLRGEDVGPVDLVAGGIPCQPFSDAGLRKGTDDERHLWPSFRRLLRETGATFGLIENVRGLLTAQGGDAFASILADAVEDGFHVEWQLVAAGTLGAPHIRHRVFVVLRRDGHWTWPDTAYLGLFGRKRGTPDGWPPSGRMDSTGWSETPMRWPRPAVWPWEAGMLPTPKAGDGRAKGNGGARKSPGLDQMAKGGMLPTPTRADGERMSDTYGRGNCTLIGATRMLPTPSVGDMTGSRTTPAGTSATGRRPDGSKAQIGLREAVTRMLPTPMKADGNRGTGNFGRGNPTLLGAVKMLPTPSRTDSKDRDYQRANGRVYLTVNGAGKHIDGVPLQAGAMLPTPSASEVNTNQDSLTKRLLPGKLHPTNVEWAMGWPKGWTEFEGPSLADDPLQTWDAWPDDPWTTTGKPLHRRQRLKGCGNGVVAQVAELVGADLLRTVARE